MAAATSLVSSTSVTGVLLSLRLFTIDVYCTSSETVLVFNDVDRFVGHMNCIVIVEVVVVE